MSKLESKFQSNLIREIKSKYPECLITKLDAGHTQGLPDILMLHGNKWCCLEVKRDASAKHQPNQDYYVDRLNKMGFARFIYPENKDTVLMEMDEYLH